MIFSAILFIGLALIVAGNRWSAHLRRCAYYHPAMIWADATESVGYLIVGGAGTWAVLS